MNFAKTISIFITSIFTRRVIDAFMLVTPFWKAVIDIIFIRVNQAAFLDYFGQDGLDRHLLNVG